MVQLSYAEKVTELKKLSAPNFTNRTMLMLTGAEDLLIQERYKNDRYYIDLIYDMAMPELAEDPTRPSKALTAVAFAGSFRSEDYRKLINTSKTASATELKEFLTQEVDHEPKERVVNYLSLPLLTMMTEHLKPWDAADILLIEPNLIKNCPSDIRSKTFRELIPENTYLLLQRKAAQELQEDLKINNSILLGWDVAFTATRKGNKDVIVGKIDGRTVESLAHWANVKEARKKTAQTGTGAKIQQWLKNNREHS